MEQTPAGIESTNYSHPTIASFQSEKYRNLTASVIYSQPMCLYVALTSRLPISHGMRIESVESRVFDSSNDAVAYCVDWLQRQEERES